MTLFSNTVNLTKEQLFPLVLIVVFALVLILFFINILLLSSKNKKTLKNFVSGKNNLRLFTINYKDQTVYVVDKKDFKNRRIEDFRWFFNSFTKEDSIRVKVWVNELIRDDRKVKDNLEAQVLIGKNQKIFSVLTCTGIDRENSILHIESHLFPEIKNRRLNRSIKESHISSYRDLSSIYHQSKNEKFNVYLIRLFSLDETINKKSIWDNKVLTTLLISKIKRYLSGSMKLCLTKNNELIILESHISNKNKSIAYGHKFSSEVSKLLFLNSLQNSYQHRIGIATGHAKKQTFDELVNFAKKMTIEAQEENNEIVIYNSHDSHSEVKKETIELINRIIANKLVDVTYTSMLNCSNGHLKGFYTNILIKSDLFDDYLDMEEYANSYSLLKPLLKFFFEEINQIYINKYFITSEERRLFLKVKPQYYKEILFAVNEVILPENVKTVFLFNDKDIIKEASNNKFIYDVIEELKNDPRIRLGLEFTTTSLELPDDLLKMFDYYIFDQESSFANILTSTQDQILLQNLVNNLMDFSSGKLSAVNLKSWQSIEYFSSLGFTYVSGSYFGMENNKAPTIDTKRINKLLSLYD